MPKRSEEQRIGNKNNTSVSNKAANSFYTHCNLQFVRSHSKQNS